MLMMRLQRVGRKNDPSYRIVVTDTRTGPKSNKHVDLLGSYNPKMGTVIVDGARAKEWISKGVQLSDTVNNLLITHKVIEGKKINNLPRKSPVIDEAKVKAEAEAKAAAEAKAIAEAEAKAAAEATPEVVEETPAEAVVAEAEEKTEEVTA
jgi:small subunit ribosomal protein S16